MKKIGTKLWRNWAVAVTAILILGGAAFSAWHYFQTDEPTAGVSSKQNPTFESSEKASQPLPDKPSIAVLPFTNLSKDPEQNCFADGVTEDIINGLSKTPKLFVIARNSTFTYQGKPVKVQEVSENLGVRYVLEGSIQKSGDRV